RRVSAPEADAHNPVYRFGGQFVRVEPEGEPKNGLQTVRWTPDGSGSHVALFPISDHLHGIGDQEAQRPTKMVGSGKIDEFGAIPYVLLTIAGLGIFLGCVGKSAQFPLHV